MRRKPRSADVEGLVTHATTDAPTLVEAHPTVVLGLEDAGPDLPTERIDPAQLLGASVLIALVLSAPSLSKAVDGRVSLFTAGWYFGWAVIVATLGVWLLWAVWHSYRRPLDEQRRRDWEQARAERLGALEAESLARLENDRQTVEEAVRAEAEALRTAAPPDLVERTEADTSETSELPRSLREALESAPTVVGSSVAVSDPSVGSR